MEGWIFARWRLGVEVGASLTLETISHLLCQANGQQKSASRQRVGEELCGEPCGPHDITFAYLHDAHDNDEGQGQELPSCEDVLNPGGPANTGAVDPSQQH